MVSLLRLKEIQKQYAFLFCLCQPRSSSCLFHIQQNRKNLPALRCQEMTGVNVSVRYLFGKEHRQYLSGFSVDLHCSIQPQNKLVILINTK